MVIAFNNCAGFTSPAIGLKSFAASSASCSSGQKTMKVALAQYEISETCEEHANYRCDVREFRPGIGNSTDVVQSCLTTQIGEVCLPVSISKYDTALNLGLSELDSQAFSSGGEFNHSEASCFNTKVIVDGQAALKAEAQGLQQALQAVITKCRERSP
jgi:hypothetical protein